MPLAQLPDAVEEVLGQLRNKPRGSIGVAKAMMEANRHLSGRAAVESELGRFVEWAKGDPLASEGMRAFVEKRDPVWVTEADGPDA